ncbi:hypothetical protein [uncultured Paraglaciecola sp.]|uniref:hypothetical protein n=1 Tax=uncultured Paraglaciecola sp. TaxID=1765024 RepID=UPI002593E4C3|nr:hypothetical protein [uncultured Paraglaciecola sp.]
MTTPIFPTGWKMSKGYVSSIEGVNNDEELEGYHPEASGPNNPKAFYLKALSVSVPGKDTFIKIIVNDKPQVGQEWKERTKDILDQSKFYPSPIDSILISEPVKLLQTISIYNEVRLMIEHKHIAGKDSFITHALWKKKASNGEPSKYKTTSYTWIS